MKKFTLLFLAVIYIFCCTFALTACNKPNTPNNSSNQSQISSQQNQTNSNTQQPNIHIHNYDKWYSNETEHWKVCSGEGLCDARIAEQGSHLIDTQENICSVCQKKFGNAQTSETNVLIVDGDGKQATNMQALLSEMEYTSTVITPQNFPTSLENLIKYSEIILMNVNVADLPSGCDIVLDSYVKNFGGGLFTTGGDRTYYYGGMDGTSFDSMLPVNVIPEDNSVNAIMFVVDGSASMYYDFNKGGSSDSDCFYDQTSEGFKNTPLAYVKTGLEQASYNIFNKKDYIALMHFGKPKDTYVGYSIDLPLTPASQRGAFLGALDKIQQNPAKGTNWSVPLQAAAEHLRSTAYKVDKKQIIFITDGDISSLGSSEINTDFAKMTKSFEENWGITTSVITVNSAGSNATTDLMENITTAVNEEGKKRFYNCTTPEMVSKAISDECKAASIDTTNKGGNYEVEITSAAAKNTIFDGITVAGDYPQKGIMPNIPQYNGVTVKTSEGVEALLTANNTENKTHDAIYAQWTYGKGRVGSFASDLGSWADKYYTDPEAKQFLKNAIKEILLKKTI